MGQTSFEVMQSIGQASLDAAIAFSEQAPRFHFILTVDRLTPASRPPLAKDGILYASEEEAKKGLPIVQEQVRDNLTRIHQPEPLSLDDTRMIQEGVDAIHVVAIEEGKFYRLPHIQHRVLRHTHGLSDDPSSELTT